MKSTAGRPRVVTDEQVTIILAWYARYSAWCVMRPEVATQGALAQRLRLSKSTVSRIIRYPRLYKQSSPERHHVEKARRRQVMQRLR